MTTNKIKCDPVNNESVEDLFYWNTPEDKTIDECELTCNNGWNSNSVHVTSYFVQILRDFFSDPNNINDSHVRELIINKPIEVQTMSSIDTDTAGSIPKIYVEFGGKQTQQNFAIRNSYSYNNHNSSEQFYSHWQIGISIHVIGNTLNESLLIAEEACSLIHCYQVDICKNAGFMRCQIAEMSKPQYLEDSTSQKAYLCTVSLSVVVPYIWRLIQQAPVLKRVTFNTEVNNI